MADMRASPGTQSGPEPGRTCAGARGPALFGAPLVVGLLALLGPYGHAQAQVNCNVGIEFYPGGAIRSCILNGHHRLHLPGGQILTCADSHPLVQYPDGRVQSCTLHAPLTVGTRTCPAGSRVEFGPDGTLTTCAVPRTPSRGDGVWLYALGQEVPPGPTPPPAQPCERGGG
jgi:hypothetical protein